MIKKSKTNIKFSRELRDPINCHKFTPTDPDHHIRACPLLMYLSLKITFIFTCLKLEFKTLHLLIYPSGKSSG